MAPEVLERVLTALRAGSSRDEAARHAELAETDLERRLERDPELAAKVEAAEAASDVGNVAAIAKAAKGGDWRAAQFLLGRRGRAYDPAKHCGAHSKRTGEPCTQVKGHRTDHPSIGRCWLHGGASPQARKAAAAEMAARAVATLGVPAGSGDPMGLLTKTVQHAEGYLEGTAAMLKSRADKEGGSALELAAAASLHVEAIRAAARTGKAAIDAKLAERQAALDERAANLLERFIGELLERVVPAKRQPELRIWARERLGQLAAEYDGKPGQVH